MKLKKLFMKFKLDEVIGGVVLMVMLIITFMNVLSRYVFKTAWAFTEEIDCALLVLVGMLGAAGSARKGAFLGLDLLSDAVSPFAKKLLFTLQAVTIAVFAVIMVRYGMISVINDSKFGIMTAALKWPLAIFDSAIPIGGIFMFIGALQRIVELWATDKEKEEKEDKNA